MMGYYDKDNTDYKNLKSIDGVDIDKLDWTLIRHETPDELFTPEFVEKYKDKLIGNNFSILERYDLDERCGFLDYILSKSNDFDVRGYNSIPAFMYKIYNIVRKDYNRDRLKNKFLKIRNKLIEFSENGFIKDGYGIILKGNKSDIVEYYTTHRSLPKWDLYDIIFLKYAERELACVETDEIKYELVKQNILPKCIYISWLIKHKDLFTSLKSADKKIEDVRVWLKEMTIIELDNIGFISGMDTKRDGISPDNYRKNVIDRIITSFENEFYYDSLDDDEKSEYLWEYGLSLL